MWYFAYGSDLNSRAVSEWCRHHTLRAPSLKPGRPSVLDNYRLCFPIFSEYWQGGIADIVYDPGKYVAGGDCLIYLIRNLKRSIKKSNVASMPPAQRSASTKRITVKVSPLGKGESVEAVTYQGITVEKYHIPPTQSYMDLVIQGAYSHGLSMMWISYLQSFSTQAARKVRPPV